ncbi:MAG: hypothetical protein JWM76_1318 [Pseudonocardiales bacterium]|nr:hypothetical protein [Pseudonocardiales bacterium]
MDNPPLVITGMHRSGTSVTARLLHDAGLDVGRHLLGPSVDNRVGYYEDLEFCDLNLDLISTGVGDPQLQPDWAFPDRIKADRLVSLRPRAAELISARRRQGRAWGFKDPRTSVLLNFYDELAPDARYLFVYRSPWDVLTSLLGTQNRPLQGRADLAVQTWTTYNQRLLRFRARHPERTVLVHVDAIADRPNAVLALVQSQAPPGTPELRSPEQADETFVKGLLRRGDASSALAELVAADHPEATAVYRRLEAAADLRARTPLPAMDDLRVDVETLRGEIDIAAVLAGAPADGIEAVTRAARPSLAGSPTTAADAAISRLTDDIVMVLFDGQLRPEALTIASSALRDAPDLAAVLLAPGGATGPALDHDPLWGAEGGAGIVVRREAWLATGGFAAADAPPGYEAWAFAVACVALGLTVARVDGALHLPGNRHDDADVRRRVLAAHPEFAARRAVDWQQGFDAANADRALAVAELTKIRSTRAWQFCQRMTRLRALLRRSRLAP